jgi:hypothetical protein
MKSPEDKSVGYTALVVVCAIAIGIVLGVVAGLIGRPAMMGAGGLPGVGATGRTSSGIEFDKDSRLGKLQALGKQMEEAGKKMEAAQKSGNPQEQMKAAMEGLGTMIGGGKRYDPLGIDQLKPFVPESLPGLPRTSSSAEKSGIGGFMVSKALASYGDAGGRRVDLEIADTGGASGLMGLAAWANVEGEKEDDNRVERTRKEGGRLVHQTTSKSGGPNECSIVLADRFVVTARGQGVPVDQLQGVVTSLDLGKLESMKEVGAQK